MPLSSPQLSTSTLSPADKYSAAILSTPGLFYYWRLEANNPTREEVKALGSILTGTNVQSVNGLVGAGSAERYTASDTYRKTSAVTVVGPPVTVEAWATLEAYPIASSGITAFRRLVNGGTTGTGIGWGLGAHTTTGRVLFTTYGKRDHENTTFNWSLSLRSHVVATTDGANLAIYLNGFQGYTFSGANAGVTTGSVAISIGGDGTGAQDWPGTVDEVAIYSRALSATEVRHHYELGIGL